MKRFLASIILAGSFFAPALAFADGPRTTAFVHVQGDDRATLESQSPGGEWKEVCSAPCDRDLPLGVQYRIGGDGVRPSAPFYLDRDTPRIDLDVSLATAQAHHAGVALAAIGGGGVALGAVFLAIGSMHQYGYTTTTIPTTSGLVTIPSGVTDSGPNNGLMIAGGVVLGIGAAFAIGGIVLAVVSSKTTVEQLTYVAASRSEVAVAPRTPTWRAVSPSAPDATRPMIVPLFSGTF